MWNRVAGDGVNGVAKDQIQGISQLSFSQVSRCYIIRELIGENWWMISKREKHEVWDIHLYIICNTKVLGANPS